MLRTATSIAVVVLVGCASHETAAPVQPPQPPPQPSDPCGSAHALYVEGRAAGLAGDLAKSAVAYAQACKRGDGAGCYADGTAFNVGEGESNDPDRARAMFERAAPRLERGCASSCGDACALLGWTLHTEQGQPHDGPRAIAMLEKSCRLRSGEGCFLLSQMYGFGYEVAVDYAKSHALALEACDMSDSLGCNAVAYDYEQGHAVAADPAMAKQFHQRACKLGLQASCAVLSGALPDEHE